MLTLLSVNTRTMNHSTEQSETMLTDGSEGDGSEGGIIVACIILGISFLVGAPGNLLVIWTILRHVKKRAHIVVLILHLAAADLLVLITLPLWIYSLSQSWLFGGVFYKALVYVVTVSMFSSILLITMMSVERYLAICHPFAMMRLKANGVMNGCLVLLWILALFQAVPSLFPHHGDDGFIKEFSSVTQAIALVCLETLGGFVVPFIVLSICYCQVVKKLRKMMFKAQQKSIYLVQAVWIAFILCWLPHHVINVLDLFCICKSDSKQSCVPSGVVFSSGALVCISSSVNPVLYVFFAKSLRKSLKECSLVQLFQEMASHCTKFMELAVQHHSSQRAADTESELMTTV